MLLWYWIANSASLSTGGMLGENNLTQFIPMIGFMLNLWLVIRLVSERKSRTLQQRTEDMGMGIEREPKLTKQNR